VRRRKGTLVALEVEILGSAATLASRDEPEFHGFGIAKLLQTDGGARRLTAHGTLYKALARLEDAGLLVSRWEDADLATSEGRPRRRLYRITTAGQAAQAQATAPPLRAPRWDLA
jgi:DNA-binding PadR family transcriptional regulator